MRNTFLPYEQQFSAWVDDGFPEVDARTVEFLDHLLSSSRDRPLWPGQREGLLRAIYAYERLGKRNLLLNIVTGGGKTAIIGACIAWLRWVYDVRSFVVLCPNTVVRERLRADFSGAKVFHEFEMFPAARSHYLNDLTLHVLESGAAAQGMFESGIVLGNIHQLYGREANERLAFVMNFLGNVAIFNDEAHNTPASEYTDVLRTLARKQVFRLDTTATPDRADGQEPDSEMIYEYGIGPALADGIIKSTVVYEPDVASVELTYSDPDTGEQVSVEEIDWEAIDDGRLKPTKWVTDPEPRRHQLRIALARLEEQEGRAHGRYKPILFVVAVGIRDAREIQRELEQTFDVPALVVTGESDDDQRQEAMHIGDESSPYRAVVSVLMLREGWDVPEVSVIALLRKFSSRVYGQQIIGRGLRKIIREPGEREILCVVDHPKLDHSWLWDLVGAKVRSGVKEDDVFELEEDLPELELPLHPELDDIGNLIEVPDGGSQETDTNFDHLLDEVGEEEDANRDWRNVLAAAAYGRGPIEITKVTVRGVKSVRLDPTGFVEFKAADGHDESLGEIATEEDLPPARELAERLKQEILGMVDELLFEKGFAGVQKDLVYSVVMDHIDEHFLDGVGLAQASPFRLLYAIDGLSEVRDTFMRPGVVAGIVTFPPVDAT